MKTLFRRLHLWLSLPFGIVFSIICLTGALLIFEKEITAAIAPAPATADAVRHDGAGRPDGASRSDGASRPDGAGHAHARPSRQDAQTAPAADRPATAHAPQTGTARAGHARPPQLPFFREVRKLHRWLLDAPAKKGEPSVGKWVVGISTLMMVIVLISGVVVWWPRHAGQWRRRLTLRLRQGWRPAFYDSHVALGIYATAFLLLMALTGLTWSFGWYRQMAYGLFDGLMPADEVRRLFYSLHTGQWGGLLTKTLYFLSALIGALLPWSGYWMWLKHRKRRASRAHITY